jgi:hypothetical protein
LATIGAVAALAGAPLAAQSTARPTADQAMRQAQQAYGPPGPNDDCERSSDGQIVVCAGDQENEKYRVKPTSEVDPESDEALDDGVPRAPDFAESCKKAGQDKACIGFGSVPPPTYFIDFDELPDAPEGSDADRISKGEILPD